jgi:hypothetical protein
LRGLTRPGRFEQSSVGAVAGEREFGRLKNEWALLPLRVRGIERVRLHADLEILAKLRLRAQPSASRSAHSVGAALPGRWGID